MQKSYLHIGLKHCTKQNKKFSQSSFVFDANKIINAITNPNLLLGFALAEATGLFGLVIALIILFASNTKLDCENFLFCFVQCFSPMCK
jgi:hypothetical protein